jgi:hypothetical protein
MASTPGVFQSVDIRRTNERTLAVIMIMYRLNGQASVLAQGDSMNTYLRSVLAFTLVLSCWACAPDDDDPGVLLVFADGSLVDQGVGESLSDAGVITDMEVAPPEPDMMVEPPEPALVPEFGRPEERRILIQARRSDGLSHPRDLEFDPDDPTNLWVVDRDWDGNIILFGAGTADQRIERMRDMAASHFMEEVSGVAFSNRGSFATCQESRNGFDGFAFPNDFMGPALWSTDLMIHCSVNQAQGGPLNGSHLDMLHQSPMCMGITHQDGHAFFVTDGGNGHVVRYDFREPHVPGGDDHSDGQVSRYPDLTFTRVADIPSHLFLDGDNLYYADTGTGAIRVADVSTGSVAGTLRPDNEPLALYNQYRGVDVRVFVDGLDAPSGIVVANDRVFVSLPRTGEIIAYELDGTEIERINTGAPGVMGLEMASDGRLWFTNAYQGTVNVIEPGPIDMPEPEMPSPVSRGDCAYPEWNGEIGVGHVLPPFTWSNAHKNGQVIGDFGAIDIFCDEDWADVDTVTFVVYPEWIPWLFEYVAYVDALAPQIQDARGRIVYVGAQDLRGGLLNSQQANTAIAELTPQGSGVRVGEADNTYATRLIDTGLIDHMPSSFVVRRSDMTVLATQRTRALDHLPLVEMAQDPDADWSNPGPATIIPVLPSNCEEGDDEIYEPNDFPEQAATIGVGRFQGGVCARQGDFYYVDVQGPWTMELSFSHAVGDLDLMALRRNGQPIADGSGRPAGASSSTDDEIFEWQGPVMVYVFGYDGATAPYRLVIRER